MDITFIISSIAVFLGIILVLVVILLTAKRYLMPSGTVAITINDKEKLEVAQGSSLLSTLSENGVYLSSACGGKGSCGQCKVQVVEGGGEILDVEKGHFTRKEIKEGFRLGCQCKVKGDISIQVPESVLGVKEYECTVVSNNNVASFIKEFIVALPEGEHMDFIPGSYAQIKIPTAATTPAPAVPEAPPVKPSKARKPVDVDKLKAELSEWGAWASMPQLGSKKPQDKKKSKVGGPSLVYRFPGDSQVLQEVDIAVVMESTYPFTAGDTAVSVQNIIRHNPDLTFGVIHIADNSNAPAKSMFELPANVKWVDVIYLESTEVSEKFSSLVSAPVTDEQVREVLDAIESSVTGNHELMHVLYENAINPQTRTWSAWGALGHREFMNAAIKAAGKADDISLSQLFDLAYNFFLRIYTLLDRVLPTARVYHAHSSGNAGLVAAAGAVQNKGKFFLTEHNLNIRDSINKLLSRDLNRRVTSEAPLKLTTDTFERFWTQWWLELGALNYAEAELITYLYPQAVTDAQELGGAQEKAEVLPDGIEWEDLEIPRIWRQQAVPKLERKISWKLAVVGDFQPSKGIIELIDAVKIMVDGGKTDVRVDLLKPADGSTTDEPEYYSRCVAHIKQLSVENYVRLRDVKDARDVMHEYDALVVPSFQESQPHAALVAMTMGVPIIGSSVGGMNALVTEELSDAQHKKIGASGELVPPGDSAALATLMAKLTQSPELYRAWHENALARIKAFYLLPQVMRRYNAIYRNLGAGKHKVIGGMAMVP